MRIVFFGEALVEINNTTKYASYGGDVPNTALYLSRLGQSRAISVSYATAVGTDKLSLSLLASWHQEGIDTSLVRYLSTKFPDLCYIETDRGGHCYRHFWNKDNAARYYFSIESSPLEVALSQYNYHAIYISAVSFALLTDEAKATLLVLLEKYKIDGGKVYFDNRYRPHMWTPQQARYWICQLLPYIDIAFIEIKDEQRIWGSSLGLIERYSHSNCCELIIKQYRDYPISDLKAPQTSMKISVIQSIGQPADYIADNAFIAGYLAGRISGKSIRYALNLGKELTLKVQNHSRAVIPAAAMRDMM
ncbi:MULTISPECIES: PfkB family carbohydrate kinase [unclassified Photobacterium]|uniref:PfkB family carbohydrate kinase n=1 Tax=unclassified Photobacterium TaxID=2628852 RepID=UPI001EE03396|nr:2-dehydro-3-deoxygluconokinase [Photobacterium sp. Ph6]MCG3875951.1 2-dehydro-3-deoxygluconokinase [Photobacterium sp. Ph5]